jgi:two-component system, LytTR family, response regulator
MERDLNTRVLIVDDEPLARRGVAIRLAHHPKMTVVGEGASGEEALSLISTLRPDLIFLDIQLPDMSGIEVLRFLPVQTIPAVIFLTAFDEYAVAAFELQALDYLLKPLEEERFNSALKRATRLLELEQHVDLQERLQVLLHMHAQDSQTGCAKRFAVRKGHQVSFVLVSDIEWIEGTGDYAGLHVGKKTHLIHRSLTSLEKKLNPEEFIRIHRSTIVRVDRIGRIEPLSNRDCELMLLDGTSLRVSRTYSGRLWSLLKGLGM